MIPRVNIIGKKLIFAGEDKGDVYLRPGEFLKITAPKMPISQKGKGKTVVQMKGKGKGGEGKGEKSETNTEKKKKNGNSATAK